MKEKLSSQERRALGKVSGNGIYLYCISSGNLQDNFGLSGFEGNNIYTITYNNLAAVVSDAPVREYEPTEENIVTHKDVVLKVLKNHSVLPAAFGMVFKNKNALLTTMRSVYPLLWRSLLTVDNKVELGVKVILPKEGINIKKFDGRSQGDFLKGLEHDFLANLGEVAKHSKKGALFSERLALNAHFLVEKDRIEEFSKKLEILEKKYTEFKVQYSGPWPAYNFVDIKIMSKLRGGN